MEWTSSSKSKKKQTEERQSRNVDKGDIKVWRSKSASRSRSTSQLAEPHNASRPGTPDSASPRKASRRPSVVSFSDKSATKEGSQLSQTSVPQKPLRSCLKPTAQDRWFRLQQKLNLAHLRTSKAHADRPCQSAQPTPATRKGVKPLRSSRKSRRQSRLKSTGTSSKSRRQSKLRTTGSSRRKSKVENLFTKFEVETRRSSSSSPNKNSFPTRPLSTGDFSSMFRSQQPRRASRRSTLADKLSQSQRGSKVQGNMMDFLRRDATVNSRRGRKSETSSGWAKVRKKFLKPQKRYKSKESTGDKLGKLSNSGFFDNSAHKKGGRDAGGGFHTVG